MKEKQFRNEDPMKMKTKTITQWLFPQELQAIKEEYF